MPRSVNHDRIHLQSCLQQSLRKISSVRPIKYATVLISNETKYRYQPIQNVNIEIRTSSFHSFKKKKSNNILSVMPSASRQAAKDSYHSTMVSCITILTTMWKSSSQRVHTFVISAFWKGWWIWLMFLGRSTQARYWLACHMNSQASVTIIAQHKSSTYTSNTYSATHLAQMMLKTPVVKHLLDFLKTSATFKLKCFSPVSPMNNYRIVRHKHNYIIALHSITGKTDNISSSLKIHKIINKKTVYKTERRSCTAR